MTETARRADVVLPAASAYEKVGSVTNVCGEVQRLKRALSITGAKPDLEIMGLIAREMRIDVGVCNQESVFEEIRKVVRGYNIPLPVIAAGGAVQAFPVNGPVSVPSRPGFIESSGDTLFTSGTLGRFSKALNSVIESPGGLYRS